jgi:hypothetical protein
VWREFALAFALFGTLVQFLYLKLIIPVDTMRLVVNVGQNGRGQVPRLYLDFYSGMGVSVSHERELMYTLDILRLELDIARRNDYEFMQKRIERAMALVARKLVETRDFEPPPLSTR